MSNGSQTLNDTKAVLYMKPASSYSPVFALTRGEVVESLHYGAVAVVDVHGKLVAWYGDPEVRTFLRSSAKPFQALPFLAHGGKQNFGLTDREVAILCASHSGTDEHVEVVRRIQKKTGVSEDELLCGIHAPIHEPTARILNERHEEPTPNRHNCSGKHTGMLAFARLMTGIEGAPAEDLPYIDPNHTIQQEILTTFASMCKLPVDRISTGIDGCSAPIFSVPLYNAAFAYARLCDPEAGNVNPNVRRQACKQVTKAMISHPDMVGGPERFDTLLMAVGREQLVTKGGAEAFMGVGVMNGALGSGSPAMGIAIKIADGGGRSSVLPAVTLEVLRQLGVLSKPDLEELSVFGPCFPVRNWRKLVVGQASPMFTLSVE